MESTSHLSGSQELHAGADLVAQRPASRLHRLQQSAYAHDHHHALHVVGEHVERHLGGHLWQLFREKVRCSHPAFHCAERMLRRLTADTHCIGVVIEPILNLLQNGLVLPSRDASLAASRALGLERTALASGMASFLLVQNLQQGNIGETPLNNARHRRMARPLFARNSEIKT